MVKRRDPGGERARAERLEGAVAQLPRENVTVPVGVPAVELTVAVNVTAWPDRDGL